MSPTSYQAAPPRVSDVEGFYRPGSRPSKSHFCRARGPVEPSACRASQSAEVFDLPRLALRNASMVDAVGEGAGGIEIPALPNSDEPAVVCVVPRPAHVALLVRRNLAVDV